MKLRVYHNPDFMTYRRGTIPKLADCTAVAELEVESLEDAFTLTNTVDEHWWENGIAVKLFEGDGCRSTSTGDVILDLDTNEVWVVQMFGFTKGDADGNAIQN